MKVLVAYDGSILADAAIEDLKRAGLPRETEALVVSVADGGLTRPPDGADIEADCRRLAAAASDRLRSSFPHWTVSSEAAGGSAAKTILDITRRWRPDLLVAGSHGRSPVSRLFLGSVSMELVHKAPCSVRVVRAGASPKGSHPIRIIVGADGSAAAQQVIHSVAGRSWPEGTEAHIISVVQTLALGVATTALEAGAFAQEPAYSVILEADERERDRLRKAAGEAADRMRGAGLAATTVVVDGDPREVLLTAAEALEADAIFVGARGLGRMQRLLLGSVSSYIVMHADRTVEVVRRAAV